MPKKKSKAGGSRARADDKEEGQQVQVSLPDKRLLEEHDDGLNELEKEIAFLAEMALVFKDESSNTSNNCIDWTFIEKEATVDLHNFIVKKRSSYANFTGNRKKCLIRGSRMDQFESLRLVIRKCVKQGILPEDIADRAKNFAQNITCQRPVFSVGQKVFASWQDDEGGTSWFPGKIRSYSTVKTHKKYGEIRAYNVDFDDGDESNNLSEVWVFSRRDYNLEAEVDEGKRKLKGVTNHLSDPNTGDDYAISRGWFTTEYTGCKRFTSLEEAMLAHDKALVEKKRREGVDVRRDNLNLPNECDAFQVGRKG